MSTAIELLPIREVVEPETGAEVATLVRECAASRTPIYPIGGATSLDYGRMPDREGIGLSLARLKRIVDYPARDMTVTVEAGVTLTQLADALSAENQRLPIDAPNAAQATVGGVVATNTNGPRRYSQGNVRDQVIGIRAVDGTGRPFAGGGRVVKNVAGYDFCKLLTGSLGTLGVITELTFKLRPIPPHQSVLLCAPHDLPEAGRVLLALAGSSTTPSAIELFGGPEWSDRIPGQHSADLHGADLHVAVLLEGTVGEVTWMQERLAGELRDQVGVEAEIVDGDAGLSIAQQCIEFPAEPAAVAVKCAVVPSHTERIIEAARKVDPCCSFLAHAGNGVVVVKFAEFPEGGLSRGVVGTLQPAASNGQGSVVLLAHPGGSEATRQSIWGTSVHPMQLMTRVRGQFDPHQILNPGRFVYD